MKSKTNLINKAKLITFACVAMLFQINSSAQTDNTTLGTGAGVSITTGDYNVLIGDSAGTNLSTGSGNVFIGEDAGHDQQTAGTSRNDVGDPNNFANGNIFIGQNAGYSNTTGTDCIFIGPEAGRKNLSATDNVFIGADAGRENTTGVDNTFIGDEAGKNHTTGSDNTFIGEDSGYNSTTASDNTAVGSAALRSCTTGYRNAAVGNEALYDVTNGHHNVGFGDSAGTDIGQGIYNTMIGAAAGANTEHADYNTFVGTYSGWDNNRTNNTNDANRNTYVGVWTGGTNRQGQDNVGMGAFADFDNTIRNRATFIGADSRAGHNDIVAVGYQARVEGQYGISVGNYTRAESTRSVAIGYGNYVYSNNGVSISPQSTATTRSIGTSSNNGVVLGTDAQIADNSANSVAIGYGATLTGAQAVVYGYLASTTADNTIVIGANASATGANSMAIGQGSSVTGVNSIVIGDAATVTASNEVYIGNSTTTTIGGAVNWTATSDERYKTNVQNNVPGLDFINLLNPVTYNFDMDKLMVWNGGYTDAQQKAADKKSKVVYSGFLAQEVHQAAKASGYEFSGVKVPENDKEIYGLRYAEFVVPLVKSVQELSQQVKDQQAIIAQQEKEIKGYQEAMLMVTKRLEVVEAKLGSNNNNNYVSLSKK